MTESLLLIQDATTALMIFGAPIVFLFSSPLWSWFSRCSGNAAVLTVCQNSLCL